MPTSNAPLLARWIALRDGDGLRRASRSAVALAVVGLALTTVIIYAVMNMLSPIPIAIASCALGWSIAERNALRTRLAQWEVLSQYIDWDRVRRDAGNGA